MHYLSKQTFPPRMYTLTQLLGCSSCPKTCQMKQTTKGEQQTLVKNHEPVSPNITEPSPVKRTITKSRIPRALKNLQSFNNPGLKE